MVMFYTVAFLLFCFVGFLLRFCLLLFVRLGSWSIGLTHRMLSISSIISFRIIILFGLALTMIYNLKLLNFLCYFDRLKAIKDF